MLDIKISEIANLPTVHGTFDIQSFKEGIKEHLVVMSKDYKKSDIVNIRIHSECLTGDAIGSIKCDCQAQLNFALKYVQEHGGMVIYLRQEGRDIGLFNKVNAYSLQDKGFDTIQANHQLGFQTDQRTYEAVDFILDHYKIADVNLLTNNPDKLSQIGVKIHNRIPVIVGHGEHNENYLQTKKDKMGHLI